MCNPRQGDTEENDDKIELEYKNNNDENTGGNYIILRNIDQIAYRELGVDNRSYEDDSYITDATTPSYTTEQTTSERYAQNIMQTDNRNRHSTFKTIIRTKLPTPQILSVDKAGDVCETT